MSEPVDSVALDRDWQELAKLRADTPACANLVHLNNAGASLMPRPVLATVQEYLELEANIGGYEAAALQNQQIHDCYTELGALIGAAGRNIAMVENATAAFNQALMTLPWRAGDRLLTTRNDYVSNQIAYLALRQRYAIEILYAPDNEHGEVDLDAFRRLLLEHRPRLAAVTHVPTSSGLVQPAEALGALCRETEVPLLLDACQTVGQMAIDVEALGCDFLSATGRKFLRGPRGTGFLYVSDRVLEAGWEPQLPDLRGAEWLGPESYRPHPDARRFENWEFPYALVLGSGTAARYAQQVGLERIAQRTTQLAALLRQRLATVPGVRVLDRGRQQCAIVTASIPYRDGYELQSQLRQRRINISITERSSAVLDFDDKGVGWALRAAPHYFNTAQEIDTLIEALTEIII